ncbi:HNH endonuclease [Deinococcus budaensis]|uniref:HNH nuclease domain-containing protein n=1 Tax=Deinococcus budaensis TaxID=1665626 RepID=A0A7W8GH14_9DEIO|nr:HNH endonuclease signature motif containing protein [Deinococcus budaensis]MBB5235333.1 hypothetical protein [Deinococcus budaensis]
MPARVMSHLEMCLREGVSLQRGMNFRVRGGHSVLLMSVQPGAPYRDQLSEDGTALHYEGHDAPRHTTGGLDPKTVDQPLRTPGGKPTQNGLFFEAALAAERGEGAPERVRVYEKLRPGIWADNGTFHLMGAAQAWDGARHVFIFRLKAVGSEEEGAPPVALHPERRRLIPGWVKLAVWQRDGGRCVECGARDDLQFDHVLPWARGGTSLTPDNVQLLCARHNREKSARIG